VIAGDHNRTRASPLADGNGIADFRARRVLQPDQTHKGQILLNDFLIVDIIWQDAFRKGQYAQPICRQLGHIFQDRLTGCVCQIFYRFTFKDMCALRNDGFGRAFHCGPRPPISHGNRGHALAHVVKGKFIKNRVILPLNLDVQSCFLRCAQQRGVYCIAFEICSIRDGVVAEHANFEQAGLGSIGFEPSDFHTVFGQGPGFIRSNDGHRPQ